MYRRRKKINYFYTPVIVILPYFVLLICVSVAGLIKVSEFKMQHAVKNGVTVQRVKTFEKVEFVPSNKSDRVRKPVLRVIC